MNRWAKASIPGCRDLLFSLTLFVLALNLSGQDVCVTSPPGVTIDVNLPAMRQRKVPNVNIPGANIIKGYLELLPPDYYSSTTKYPLMIFFHGYGEFGDGSLNALCSLLGTYSSILPMQLERRLDPKNIVAPDGKKYSFIYISPQLGWGTSYTVEHVDALLSYLIAKYRVDPRRVFLTGMSYGANVCLGYGGSSVDRVRRVAGIIPIALCATPSSAQVANMAAGNLAVWSIRCSTETFPCPGNSATGWINQLNSLHPAPIPYGRATELPTAGYVCNVGHPHNAWGLAYDSAFKINNKNIWEWAVQFSQPGGVVVPVNLKNFTARLYNGKVYLKWTTASEVNSSTFTVEKAGANQLFTSVAEVKAAGNSGSDKNYEWVDDKPLGNLSYYRLGQTDVDGNKEYFETKRILNKLSKFRIVISPNPFVDQISVFINIDRTQKVVVSLADMSGRKVREATKAYNEGASEINIKTSDLSKGIYFLKIAAEDFSETQKIVKQ